MENLIKAKSETTGNPAITAESNLFEGIRGISHAGDSHGAVVGINDNQTPSAGPGVFGKSRGTGVWGESETWMGVYGHSTNTTFGAGVMGESTTGEGVRGASHGPHGGVVGVNDWTGDGSPGSGGNGGWFESSQGEGVRGWSKNPNHGGVVGVNTGNGVGVYGEGRIAGFFKGDVEVTGDIRLTNADFAEDFDILDNTGEPGTVMVLSTDGGLKQSTSAYDKKVAGVISGAGNFKPGIILDRQPDGEARRPLAMVGKVCCKVDATYAPIEIGDLLTSSDTSGHAMKATDHVKAFGAIIGKALGSLDSGTGLIPMLISLQ